MTLDNISPESLEEIELALNEFVDRYGDELHIPMVDKAEQDCEPFKMYQFYNDLLLVWNHICCHYEEGLEARNDVSVKVLGHVLSRN
jgi:hypothetical protein